MRASANPHPGGKREKTEAKDLRQHVAELGLALTDEQLARFAGFESALYEANQMMNLTRVLREECGVRHFLDSLLFHDQIPDQATVLDVGTGPGFPAWPLACARPDLAVTALDSNGKMLGFLRTQALKNLRVVLARAEEWGEREGFDFVTGRAVAPLAIQLEISAPFCRVGGKVVPMRTPDEPFNLSALDSLGLRFAEVLLRPLADSGVTRALPVYEKFRRSDPRYPRRWSDIRKKPLI